MVFSSSIFLFFFLPIVLAVYYPLPRALKNAFLLAASLVFYAAGEGAYVVVMLVSIALNYGFGLALRAPRRPKLTLGIAAALNLSILIYFKYAHFLLANLGVTMQPVHLPIGVSFFTFHALSYLVDIYRRKVEPQRKLIDFALYITLFPQLVAGPIIRYHDVADQFARRTIDRARLAMGIRRFVFGLAKKMLIANTLAVPTDQIFAAPPSELSAGVAWLGVVLYGLQIYFDFSAYSDMAIGLGHMLGFRFLENFNYPYVSRSVTEFWRRWHISLSNWYRDYLYIPLGGNRGSPARTYFNLVTVFFLCGLWHGASWNFIIWGLIHGLFLVIERAGLGERLARAPSVVARAYTLGVVLFGWVFFRAATLGSSAAMVAAMLGASRPHGLYPARLYLTPDIVTALIAGVIGSAPILPWLRARRDEWTARFGDGFQIGWSLAGVAGVVALLAASATLLAAGTYNPFIYFRF
ncbi:MAG TPA: MBOAT family protein [Polyangia bacterium]|nr:MBOAT family protein [Polyangia bacterium]